MLARTSATSTVRGSSSAVVGALAAPPTSPPVAAVGVVGGGAADLWPKIASLIRLKMPIVGLPDFAPRRSATRHSRASIRRTLHDMNQRRRIESVRASAEMAFEERVRPL